jgi:RNA polymerase sigma-70 factor, ECF subfamily
MQRHEVRVYHLALRMTGNAEDAADATQEAFLTAYRKLDSFRGDAAFSTWLHRVAVNACYDLLRKRQRAPRLAVVDDEDLDRRLEVASPGLDPADEVAAGTDATRALAELAEVFRAPLVLHDVMDLPYEQVAAILDVPIGTVKSRLHRGRVQLARAMGVQPGEHRGHDDASKGRTP